MIWEYLREEEFNDAIQTAKGVCAVPIGCLEKHGPHSPLGTDTIIAENTAIQASKIEPVVIFPTMYFGEKSGAGEFKGTVIFSIETRWQIFKETCNEIYRNGFNKVVFCNGHGGNSSMLGLFSRRMLEENPNLLVFTTNTGGTKIADLLAEAKEHPEFYSFMNGDDFKALEDFVEKKKHCGHACLLETARAYHFRPETVRLDLISAESGESIKRFEPFSQYKISSPFSWMADYPNSYSGSNDYVLNERIAKAITEYSIRRLAERFKLLKEETISTEFQKEWLAKR